MVPLNMVYDTFTECIQDGTAIPFPNHKNKVIGTVIAVQKKTKYIVITVKLFNKKFITCRIY